MERLTHWPGEQYLHFKMEVIKTVITTNGYKEILLTEGSIRVGGQKSPVRTLCYSV